MRPSSSLNTRLRTALGFQLRRVLRRSRVSRGRAPARLRCRGALVTALLRHVVPETDGAAAVKATQRATAHRLHALAHGARHAARRHAGLALLQQRTGRGGRQHCRWPLFFRSTSRVRVFPFAACDVRTSGTLPHSLALSSHPCGRACHTAALCDAWIQPRVQSFALLHAPRRSATLSGAAARRTVASGEGATCFVGVACLAKRTEHPLGPGLLCTAGLHRRF